MMMAMVVVMVVVVVAAVMVNNGTGVRVDGGEQRHWWRVVVAVSKGTGGG